MCSRAKLVVGAPARRRVIRHSDTSIVRIQPGRDLPRRYLPACLRCEAQSGSHQSKAGYAGANSGQRQFFPRDVYGVALIPALTEVWMCRKPRVACQCRLGILANPDNFFDLELTEYPVLGFPSELPWAVCAARSSEQSPE